MLRWNSGAVLQRLDHFRLKAPFIRTLTIADALSGGDEQGFLPKEIIPALIDGLECAGNLKSLSFIGPKARSPAVRLPYAVWLWISRHDFQSLSFYENIGPPECATPSTGTVEKFTVSLYKDGSARFLDLVHPHELYLRYPRSNEVILYPEIAFFKPGPAHANLRIIRTGSLTIPEDCPMPLFNFSGVPYADVSAYFNVGVKWELPLPPAWVHLMNLLPKIFADRPNETAYSMGPLHNKFLLGVHRPPSTATAHNRA
ncbi:hypothetical protein AcV5_001926 [Taiwanofungus camphoratus]|nr:hypothetical protein AcV5_001926 [Antrodia cinnamomea]